MCDRAPPHRLRILGWLLSARVLAEVCYSLRRIRAAKMSDVRLVGRLDEAYSIYELCLAVCIKSYAIPCTEYTHHSHILFVCVVCVCTILYTRRSRRTSAHRSGILVAGYRLRSASMPCAIPRDCAPSISRIISTHPFHMYRPCHTLHTCKIRELERARLRLALAVILYVSPLLNIMFTLWWWWGDRCVCVCIRLYVWRDACAATDARGGE